VGDLVHDPSKSPWIRGDLSIPRSLLDAVEREARDAYARDEEACGLLVGPRDTPLSVDAIVPMENRANKLHALDPESFPRTGRMYFDIDPMKFQKKVAAARAEGRPAKVLYHSHLDVGAYFSETDAQAATMGGEGPTYDLAYLVTSVRAGSVDEHRLFVWDEAARAFVPSRLTVIDGAA